MTFKYVYWMQPIDFFEKAEVADEVIQDAVLEQMPEGPRDGTVYKLLLPNPPMLTEVYLCKADNNGTIYIFSNFELRSALSDIIPF